MKSIVKLAMLCTCACASLLSLAPVSFAADKPAGESPYPVERSWPNYFLEHQKLFTEKAGTYKAASLRMLGYRELNTIARAWYLNGAQELEGKINSEALIKMGLQIVASGKSGGDILETLRYQVDADKAADTGMVLGFDFSDSGESYSVELRNSILEIRQRSAPSGTPRVSLTAAQLGDILSGKPAPASAGDIDDLNRLLSYLDREQAGFYMHVR